MGARCDIGPVHTRCAQDARRFSITRRLQPHSRQITDIGADNILR